MPDPVPTEIPASQLGQGPVLALDIAPDAYYTPPNAPRSPATEALTPKAETPGEMKPAEIERAHVRDEKTGRFKTVDKAVEAKENAATVEVKPETGEPTGGDQQPGEVTATDPKAEDKTPPEIRAVLSRYKGEIDSLRTQLEQVRASIPRPEAPKPQPRPEINAFESPEAYETALTNWAKAEGAREALETSERNRVQSEQQARAEVIKRTWHERLTTFKTDHPDYETVTGKDDLGKEPNIPRHIAVAIAESENGPAIEYYLGQHRDEAERIATMIPITGAVEIGKIAAKLATPVVKITPKPKPAPMVPVGNRSAPDTKDPAEMTTEEYAEYMKAAGRLRYATSR